MLRKTALLATALVLAALAACTNANDLDAAPPDLGHFALGHNVVVAPNLAKGPFSREADKDDWVKAMEAAVDERLSRHAGAKPYNLGVALEGYVLAKPGVPLVAAPKSLLLIAVTVWDDAAGTKLNERPKRFTVLEDLSGETMIGSGNTQSLEVQMRNLSRNAAKVIERWLVAQMRAERWFTAPVAPQGEAQPRSEAPEAVPDAEATPEADAPPAAARAPQPDAAPVTAPEAPPASDPEPLPLPEPLQRG